MQKTITARRLSPTPIVTAGSVEGYGPIFNGGVIHHDGRFHLFARGVRDGYRRNPGPGPRFVDYLSDVLVLTSEDGVRYEYQQVLTAASARDVHSYEDPRVQVVESRGAGHVLMTYTDLPESGHPWRIGVHRLIYDAGRFRLNENSGRVLDPAGHPDKDGVVFNFADGRVALIHRIYPNVQVAVFDDLEALLDPQPGYWEAYVRDLEQHSILAPAPGSQAVGAGAPPIPTPAGLLLFFHERIADGSYTANVALLDPTTARLIARLPYPILAPELEWERLGDVEKVVFVQGAVRLPTGEIYLTYGAADRCVGAAVVDEKELLRALLAERDSSAGTGVPSRRGSRKELNRQGDAPAGTS